MGKADLLVPISRSRTVRHTVDYAVRVAEGGTIHFVVALAGEAETPEGAHEQAEAERMLDRARAWAAEDVDEGDALTVHTAILGEGRYLFGPDDYATVFGDYALAHQLDRVIVDPEYWVDSVGPMLASFESALERHGLEVEEAHPARPARHERLTTGASPVKMGTLFLISYAFYLVLGDPTYWFDVVSGAAAAAIVAITLGNVTFGRQPRYPGSVFNTLRFSLYIPYLVFEIVKANILISAVILHPRLPIDPRLTRFNAKVPGGLPLLALANSITLTPGTLTVRANDQRLIVHTLIPAAREDLFAGRLERAVRLVFYGRRLAAIPTPEERGDTAIIQPTEEQ